mgnify:CR=1 FL=1
MNTCQNFSLHLTKKQYKYLNLSNLDIKHQEQNLLGNNNLPVTKTRSKGDYLHGQSYTHTKCKLYTFVMELKCIRTKNQYIAIQEVEFNHIKNVKLYQLGSEFIEYQNKIKGSLRYKVINSTIHSMQCEVI